MRRFSNEGALEEQQKSRRKLEVPLRSRELQVPGAPAPHTGSALSDSATVRGGGPAAGDSNLEGGTWRGEERARAGRCVSARRGRGGSIVVPLGQGLGSPGEGGRGVGAGLPGKGRRDGARCRWSTPRRLLRAGVEPWAEKRPDLLLRFKAYKEFPPLFQILALWLRENVGGLDGPLKSSSYQ